MASNSSTEVLRVSILSLDGVRYTTSKDGVSAAAQQQHKVSISACVSFRSSTTQPKSIAAPSSQYTTLFDNDGSDHNMLAVYSDEISVLCNSRHTNVELQWDSKDKHKQNRDAPTNDGIEQQNDTIHSQSLGEEMVPHFEIELPSSSVTPPVIISPAVVFTTTVTYGIGSLRVLSITVPEILPGFSTTGSVKAKACKLTKSIHKKSAFFIIDSFFD